MLRIKNDCLVIDRRFKVNPKDRFVCFKEGGDLVDDVGNISDAGKGLSTIELVSRAIKAGATIISDTGCAVGGDREAYVYDRVIALNGGDITFEDDPLGQFLLRHALADHYEM